MIRRLLFLLLLATLSSSSFAGRWRFDWSSHYHTSPMTLQEAEADCAAAMLTRNNSCGTNCTLEYVAGHITGFNGAGGSDFTCNGHPPSSSTYYAAAVARWQTTACPASGTNYSSGWYDIGTSPTGSIPYFACSTSACGVAFNGTSPAGSTLVSGTRHYYAKGSYDYTSAIECTGGSGSYQSAPTSAASLPASSCASGQFLATVNGVTKCFTAAGQATAEDATGATQTTTNNTVTNGDGSKTVTTTVTNNVTNQSTTTSTTYAPGATVPTLPATVTEPLGSGSGSSSTATTDPVTGKVTDSQADFCAKNPTVASCMDIGSASDTEALGTQSVVPTSITPVAVTLSSVCPANVALPHGLTFSWQPACDYASGLRPVILALAWLAAGFILLGARTDG
jgi:hypothetical protein